MKAKNKKTENKTAQTKEPSDKIILNELEEPQWSVINFETCAGSGFTYDEAVKKMAKLAEQKVSGLCIVTDEAANRINTSN